MKKRNKKRITMLLDSDILEHIKAAAERNRIPYQTLINSLLYLAFMPTNKKERK